MSISKKKEKTDLLRGTLDLLVLRTLELQPLHGVGVADRISQVTNGTFDVRAGSLFPALHRLEQDGWIVGQWGTTDEGRRIKAYALTSAGRRKLSAEKQQWARIVAAVGQVLESA
jgi:PadR family transcriptional regulator PadR